MCFDPVGYCSVFSPSWYQDNLNPTGREAGQDALKLTKDAWKSVKDHSPRECIRAWGLVFVLSGLDYFSFPLPNGYAGTQGTRAKFKSPRPGIGFYYMFGEMMDALHHLCLSTGKRLFDGGREIISIDPNQGRGDAGCLVCRLLFRSGLSWDVSTMHTVKRGIWFWWEY